jgi:hypothetical protein
MASCKDDFKLKKFCAIFKIYGPQITMHTGDRNGYLGMDMHFAKEGVLNVMMVAYLKNVITLFQEVLMGRQPHWPQTPYSM